MFVQDVNRAQEAERSLLASVLIDPSTLALVTEAVKPDDFYSEAHRQIFQSMLDLDFDDKPINVATLTAKLFGQQQFVEIGGTNYLSDISSQLPSASNVTHFAEIVRSQSILRRLSQIGDSLKYASTQPVDDVDELVTKISDDVLNLSIESGSDKWTAFPDAMTQSISNIVNAKEKPKPITTGFVDLDRMLAGLRPGTLTIVAARPAMGKTALGLNIATNIAHNQHKAVGFFSLEMTVAELTNRILSNAASVQCSSFVNETLTEEEWERVMDALSRYSDSKIYIDETAGLDILTLRERCKRMQRKHGIDIVFVDYLQLMTSKSRKVFNREQEVADISRGLKRIAKELHIPVVAMAQLNRANESRPNKRPMLSDLRESGSIEQDADCIMFIHREAYYHKGEEDDHIAEIIIEKQRSGPTGVIKLYWDGTYTRFSSYERREFGY